MTEPIAERILGDGRVLHIWPLTFGRARLHIGPLGSPFYDNAW